MIQLDFFDNSPTIQVSAPVVPVKQANPYRIEFATGTIRQNIQMLGGGLFMTYCSDATDVGGVVTCSRLWDCECKENYIHSKDVASCPVCCVNEKRDSQPDARCSEAFVSGKCPHIAVGVKHE